MKVTADSNVLVRALTGDHAEQSKLAKTALAESDTVALPLCALCELVWVLSRGYKIPAANIADAIVRLIGGSNVAVDRAATKAGLDLLTRGGDFADGVIAYEGRKNGGEMFLSFDKRAVQLVKAQGHRATSP